MKSPHKGQWRGALMFSLICVWINRWVNNREADDLRCYRAHYDVTAMWQISYDIKVDALPWVTVPDYLDIDRNQLLYRSSGNTITSYMLWLCSGKSIQELKGLNYKMNIKDITYWELKLSGAICRGSRSSVVHVVVCPLVGAKPLPRLILAHYQLGAEEHISVSYAYVFIKNLS